MRIALVVTGGVDRSGRERVIPVLVALIERLARRHHVFVYVLRYHDRPCTYPLLGATVRDLGRPAGLRRQFSALMRALRQDGPFDVLHAYWAMPAGLTTALAGRRLGVPVVVTADSGEFVALPDIDYGLQRHWRHRLAVRAAAGLASRVTVCTRAMDRLARAHGCFPVVIPIGVDCSLYRPANDAPPLAATTQPQWRLLHVASLNRVKNQPLLLHAFRRVVQAIAPATVHLDIAGEDTLGGEIQALARTLDVAAHVTFHGWLAADALAALYRRAHIVVVSSHHEAASVVALEAAAAGVPVVGTRVGYLDDWSPAGAETTAPDPTALSDGIITLLRTPARRQALAAWAQSWARSHDADWTADRFEQLYAELGRQHA